MISEKLSNSASGSTLDSLLKSAQPKAKPTQGRALVTYNRLLDSAADIITEGGLEGLNTNAVAAAAGVNVSTLYGYFTDKYALMAGLLERFQATQLAMTSIELDENSDKSLRVERLTDGLLAAFLQAPWVLSLNDALLSSPRLEPLREASLQQMVEQLMAQLQVRDDTPEIPPEQQRASFRMLLEVYLSGMRLAVKAESPMREQIISEFKCLINSYLNNYR